MEGLHEKSSKRLMTTCHFLPLFQEESKTEVLWFIRNHFWLFFSGHPSRDAWNNLPLAGILITVDENINNFIRIKSCNP